MLLVWEQSRQPVSNGVWYHLSVGWGFEELMHRSSLEGPRIQFKTATFPETPCGHGVVPSVEERNMAGTSSV